MAKATKVILKPGKEQSLLRFHPWIFSGAIQKIDGSPQEGDIVEVTGSNNDFFSCWTLSGWLHCGTRLVVRSMHHRPEIL
jgi:SAM-dependent methyltransferase (EC 2.1.1.-)